MVCVLSELAKAMQCLEAWAEYMRMHAVDDSHAIDATVKHERGSNRHASTTIYSMVCW